MTKSIPFILFLIFLVLKIAHLVTWSWWIITAPIWIMIVLFLVFLFGLFGGAAIMVNKKRR